MNDINALNNWPIKSEDLSKIYRALKNEKKYCAKMKYEMKALGMDHETVNYWGSEEKKYTEIINRLFPEQ